MMVDVEKLIAQHDQLVAEIKQLVTDLENAQRVFSSPDAPGEAEGHRRRRGSCGALASVVGYLSAIGVERRLADPLLGLWEAQVDASVGLSNPLTKPIRGKKGGRKKLSGDALHEARAAAVVTLLREDAGMTLDDAVLKTALVADLPGKSLKQFRKDITADGHRAPAVAKEHYWVCLKEWRGIQMPPKARALAALQTLRKKV